MRRFPPLAYLGGLKVWPVGSSYLKGETYGWLKLDRPTKESGEEFPAGYVHLPVHAAGEEFCKQLTAEQLVIRAGRNGFRKMEWVKTRERNEALDCRVYARAATAAMGMDGWGEGRWDRMADGMVPVSPLAPGTSAAVAVPSPTHPAQAAANTPKVSYRPSWFDRDRRDRDSYF